MSRPEPTTVGAHGPDPDRRGTFYVMTRRGAQVCRHDRLTPAEYQAVLADPAGSHTATWERRLRTHPRTR